MQKNLTLKIVSIVGIMLVFTVLIFLGNDWSASVDAIRHRGLLAGLQESIHLGLDLQGGAHFIYQVKVNEAVSAQSDAAVELLNEELKKANVQVADISKPDPVNDPDRIVIKGLSGNGAGELNRIVNEPLEMLRAAGEYQRAHRRGRRQLRPADEARRAEQPQKPHCRAIHRRYPQPH